MILCVQLYGVYTDGYFHKLIDKIHTCTPFMSVPLRGRIYSGTDKIHKLRGLVCQYSLTAAIAPTRHDALLQACNANPGRIDIHEDANNVSCNVLSHLPELQITDKDLKHLRLFGYETIGQLKVLTQQQLRAQFGVRGENLYCFIHEQDLSPLPLYVPPSQIVIVKRFDDIENSSVAIIHALEISLQEACNMLSKRVAWRIEVSALQRNDEPILSKERILRFGTAEIEILWIHVQSLVQALLTEVSTWWGVGLRLSSIRSPITEQLDLFQRKTTADDIRRMMLPRYENVMRKVTIINPWSVIPEEYAQVKPIPRSDLFPDTDTDIDHSGT